MVLGCTLFSLHYSLLGVLIGIHKKHNRNFSCQNHARWWYRLFPKLWNRIHGGGIIVEFLKSFYISSQMLDKGYVYPQKFPGFCTDLPHSNWQFFRLVPETLSRSFRQTTEKHHVFWFRQLHDQQMAFWHHRDSGRRSRTKLHQKHLFRDSEHKYNRWFLTCFREHGLPSTWRWKFTNWTPTSVSVSWNLQAF